MGLQDQCTLCHEPTRWVVTVGNRRWQVDADPHPDGTVVIVEVDGRIRGRILTGRELPAQGEAFLTHECLRISERPGPPCGGNGGGIGGAPGCGLPMNRDLARSENWLYHPACEPEFIREVARQKAAQGRRTA